MVEGEEEGSGRYKVSYSLARCNPIDNFTKRIGRAVARGRFEKHRQWVDILSFIVEAADPKGVREIVIARMEEICKDELESIRDLHVAHCDALLRKYATLIRRGAITS